MREALVVAHKVSSVIFWKACFMRCAFFFVCAAFATVMDLEMGCGCVSTGYAAFTGAGRDIGNWNDGIHCSNL